MRIGQTIRSPSARIFTEPDKKPKLTVQQKLVFFDDCTAAAEASIRMSWDAESVYASYLRMRKRSPGSQLAMLSDYVLGTAKEKTSPLLKNTTGAEDVLNALQQLRSRRDLALADLDKWVVFELKRLLKPKAEAAKLAKLACRSNVVDFPRVA